LLAVGLLRPVGLLCWPEGCFSQRAASPRGLLRWLAGSLARPASASSASSDLLVLFALDI
jgi:hypothetical protein